MEREEQCWEEQFISKNNCIEEIILILFLFPTDTDATKEWKWREATLLSAMVRSGTELFQIAMVSLFY